MDAVTHAWRTFDYLPGDTCLAFLDTTEAAGEDFQRQLAERFESRRHDRERPILPPKKPARPITKAFWTPPVMPPKKSRPSPKWPAP